MSDNSKDLINIYNINRVGNEVIWIEKMLSTNPNCIKSKIHNNNCNKNNCDNDRVGNEEWESNDLEGLE